MKLTIVSIPKAFQGRFGMIQRNAIRSWLLLEPQPRVVLLGDDAGTAEYAAEYGLVHAPRIARNEFGTPLVNDIITQAERVTPNDLVCYINADIIVFPEFLRAVEVAAGRWDRFLMVGQRINLDITEPLTFSLDWQNKLRSQAINRGSLHGEAGIDYFVFRRGLWPSIPPFALGRFLWDNWLLYAALRCGAPLVDATWVNPIIHQNHDYSHSSNRSEFELEIQRNQELVGNVRQYMIDDANWMLTPQGPRRALVRRYRARVLKAIMPWMRRHPRVLATLSRTRRALWPLERLVVRDLPRATPSDTKPL